MGLLYSFKLLLYKFGLSGNNLIPLNYQESEDVFLLRHFHPPLMQYLTIYFYFINLAKLEIYGLRLRAGGGITAQLITYK